MSGRRWPGLTLCMLIPLVLGGCWDSRQIDDLALVMMMAIDVSDEEGSYIVSLNIVFPGGIASGQQEPLPGGRGSGRTSGDGSSILDALQHIQRRVSRQLEMSHVQLIIFGEEVARRGISPVLDYFQRDPALRRTVWVAVAEGDARDLLDVEPKLEEVAALGFAQILLFGAETGLPPMLFGDFLERFSSPSAAPVAPAFRRTAGGFQAQRSGNAVFLGDQLVGFFDEAESVGLAFAEGRVQRGTVLIGSDEELTTGGTLGFVVEQARGRIVPRMEDGRLHATIRITVESRAMEQMGGGGLTGVEAWKRMEERQAAIVRGNVEAAIRRAKEWQVDVFMLGEIVARHLPREWSKLEPDWGSVFAETVFEVEVESRVLSMGMIKEPLPVRTRR